jgi:hypothetical protein
MYPYGYGYDPFTMLVGQPPPAGAGSPLGVPPPGPGMPPPQLPPPGVRMPTPVMPAVPFYPPYWGAPGCGPGGFGSCFPFDYCPPQSPFFYGETARTAVAAKTTQEPFGITTDNGDEPLAPGETRTAISTPQNVVCITDITVTRAIAVFFIITSIKTALVEHLQNGLISADSLAVDAIHPPFKATTLYPGMKFSMTIKNINPEDSLHFYATAWVIAGPNCGPCI